MEMIGNPGYPMRYALRRVLRTGIAAAFACLADFEVEGTENLPDQGPLLIVGNHFNFLDPVAIIHVTDYPLEFISGLRSPNAPAWTNIFRKMWGVLVVRRGAFSRDALLNGENVLHQGGVLAIFPEGGNWATVLRPPRPGAALVALRTGTPILPVGLDGLIDVFPSARRGKRARVVIRFGKVFGPYPARDQELPMRAYMDKIGHEMMQRIAVLIPPERRGFYSEDPVVREKARGTEIYPWGLDPEE